MQECYLRDYFDELQLEEPQNCMCLNKLNQWITYPVWDKETRSSKTVLEYNGIIIIKLANSDKEWHRKSL
jgi:hypothetical protein